MNPGDIVLCSTGTFLCTTNKRSWRALLYGDILSVLSSGGVIKWHLSAGGLALV